MSKYNSETCQICEFSQDCIKSYGNPHDGCTDKFKPQTKMKNKPGKQLSVVGKDGDMELLNEKPNHDGLILDDKEIKAMPYFDKSRTWSYSLVESMRAYYCEKATLELIKHICQYQIEKLIKLGVLKDGASPN